MLHNSAAGAGGGAASHSGAHCGGIRPSATSPNDEANQLHGGVPLLRFALCEAIQHYVATSCAEEAKRLTTVSNTENKITAVVFSAVVQRGLQRV